MINDKNMLLAKAMAKILFLPLLGLGIPAIIFFWKKPAPEFTMTEKELINFTFQPAAITPPREQAIYKDLEPPVKPPLAQNKSNAQAALADSAPGIPLPSPRELSLRKSLQSRTQSLPAVSMVYSDANSRVAIIDGHVLHEGGAIGSKKIIKIEKTRVLVRTDGKDIWLDIH